MDYLLVLLSELTCLQAIQTERVYGKTVIASTCEGFVCLSLRHQHALWLFFSRTVLFQSEVRFLWVSQEVAIATESSNNERKWASVVKDRLAAIDPELKLVQLLL